MKREMQKPRLTESVRNHGIDQDVPLVEEQPARPGRGRTLIFGPVHASSLGKASAVPHACGAVELRRLGNRATETEEIVVPRFQLCGR